MSEPALSFTAFVLSLASTAAIHFGDLPDPVSGKPGEKNLEGAAQMIEILALLDQKTRGNLTAEERQVLDRMATSAPIAAKRLFMSPPSLNRGMRDSARASGPSGAAGKDRYPHRYRQR